MSFLPNECHARGEGDETALCGKTGWLVRFAFADHYADCPECKQAMLDRLEDGPWEMWAHKRDKEPHKGNFRDVGHPLFCKAFGPGEVFPVLVEIDEDGIYYGWQSLNDDRPGLIFDHETLFKVCFTYGVEADVKAKKGRALRLKITKREE